MTGRHFDMHNLLRNIKDATPHFVVNPLFEEVTVLKLDNINLEDIKIESDEFYESIIKRCEEREIEIKNNSKQNGVKVLESLNVPDVQQHQPYIQNQQYQQRYYQSYPPVSNPHMQTTNRMHNPLYPPQQFKGYMPEALNLAHHLFRDQESVSRFCSIYPDLRASRCSDEAIVNAVSQFMRDIPQRLWNSLMFFARAVEMGFQAPLVLSMYRHHRYHDEQCLDALVSGRK